MHNAEVTMVLDSISPQGIRLSTFQLRYWRPIHSEVMTHRMFSRNAGSSRARPSAAIIDQVMDDPWGPLHWGKNQPGMQASEELDHIARQNCEVEWRQAAVWAATHAAEMMEYGAHKQIVNRLLEPFTYIDVVLSSTSFNNWDVLRIDKDADPMIYDLAERMKYVREASKPKLLQPGEWHLPYVLDEDYSRVIAYLHPRALTQDMPSEEEILEVLKMISAARCARTSYKAFDGTVKSVQDDVLLYQKLVGSQPLHASPTEHQATPDSIEDDGEGYIDWQHKELWGNYEGWIQHRKMLPGEYVTG